MSAVPHGERARGVLDGVRVLDLGRFIAAPYCGMLLADMGADVIRVEPPRGGEDRHIGLRGPHGENFTYTSLARNKRAITLDVSRAEGRDLLRTLVSRTDVFLHNYSPEAVAAFRLTYDDVRAMQPPIIYTGISCYGADGPDAHRTGFDPIAQVGSGAAALTGWEHDPPLRCGVPWVDYATGLCAALGTMLALRHRDATGEGQAVDCALLQTAVSCTAPMVAEAVVAGRERPRLGNRAAYLGPADLYRCVDGYVYVAPVTRAAWRALTGLVGRPDLASAEDLATDEQRFEHRARVDPIVAHWMASRTTGAAVRDLEAARIPCGVCRKPAEVADDPQVQARRMLEYVDLDAPGVRRVPVGGIPVRLSKTPGRIVRRPPRIGEHNDEVYVGWLGLDRRDLAALATDGVV
ncbi:MAG: CaiB/BaiF CoA transferase family protein [Vicinamibacterales bacterium]